MTRRSISLLSKFSVTSDGIHGLKVKSACINAPSQVTVKPCRSEGHIPVVSRLAFDKAARPTTLSDLRWRTQVISPLQTANFLFKIACEDPASVSGALRFAFALNAALT